MGEMREDQQEYALITIDSNLPEMYFFILDF